MPTCPLRPLRRAPSFRGISAAYRLRCGTDQCRTATAQGTREYSKTGAVQCTSQRACLPRACTSTLSPTNLVLCRPPDLTRAHVRHALTLAHEPQRTHPDALRHAQLVRARAAVLLAPSMAAIAGPGRGRGPSQDSTGQLAARPGGNRESTSWILLPRTSTCVTSDVSVCDWHRCKVPAIAGAMVVLARTWAHMANAHIPCFYTHRCG